jgi:AraC-like DNA-binding protein
MAYQRSCIFLKVESFLLVNPHSRLSDLSRKLHVERHTIEKSIREATGLSFRAHQKSRVLERAMQLLSQEGELSEKQIAALLGYRSLEAFCRFVRNATGRTPGQIRRHET